MKKYLFILAVCGLTAGYAHAADRGGDQVFQAVCTACHSPGVMGAPKLGSKDDWASRLAKGIAIGVAAGVFVPAKGGCSSCSDQEVRNAVDYMISKAK